MITLNAVVLTAHADTSQKLEQQRAVTIKTKEAHETVSKRFSELKEEKTSVTTSYRKEREKAEKLKEENQSLKANLQAKREAREQARLAAIAEEEQAEEVAEIEAEVTPAPTAQVTGDKQSWLAASGIPEHEWGYVDSIVSRESGWNPSAVNPTSGACGLGQQLPCGKWPGAWNDPVAALRAQYNYVKERYGSYANAVGFWNANHWY